MQIDYDRYLRQDRMPHIWCPGCGHGMVMKSLIRAIDRTGWPHEDIVIVSGIGCSGRIATYLNFDTVHVTHGRALPFATGIRLANPNLHIIVATGDGDALAIGGNHFIHACRRNIQMTLVLFNNGIYGMTGGQYSPTTPIGDRSTTSPYGNIEPHFDISGLAVAAGATFVARGDTYRINKLDGLLHKALMHDGFSVVEVMEGCFTTHGRRNKSRYRSNLDMLLEQKKLAHEVGEDQISHDLSEPLPVDEDGPDGPRYVHGVLHESVRENYLSRYQAIVEHVAAERAEGRGGEKIDDKRLEVRFAGSGGQGLLLSGLIFAEAAVGEDWNVVQSQSYGPEARGGASKCDLILSHRKIEYPKATQLDVLVALTQESFDKYKSDLKHDGVLLVDDSIGQVDRHDVRLYRLPIIQTARESGSKQAANIVARGALHSVLRLFPRQALLKAVTNNVPAGTEDVNEKALKAGLKLVKMSPRKGPAAPPKNGRKNGKNGKNGNGDKPEDK